MPIPSRSQAKVLMPTRFFFLSFLDKPQRSSGLSLGVFAIASSVYVSLDLVASMTMMQQPQNYGIIM